jgi:hypothetical protein
LNQNVNVFWENIGVTSKFEARAMRMAITLIALMDSIMGRQSPLVNIEHDQKFDDALVKRLAKILEELQNLED